MSIAASTVNDIKYRTIILDVMTREFRRRGLRVYAVSVHGGCEDIDPNGGDAWRCDIDGKVYVWPIGEQRFTHVVMEHDDVAAIEARAVLNAASIVEKVKEYNRRVHGVESVDI